MTQLYKLTDSIQKLKDLFDEGEIPENAIADTMEGVQGEFKDKANAIMALVRNTDATIEAVKNEAKRLTDRAKVLQNQQDSIKEYLRTNMDKSGINKIECELFTITLKKPSKIVVIDDEESLPDEFKTIVKSVKVSKTDISKALKSGDNINGAHLEDGKRALMIK